MRRYCASYVKTLPFVGKKAPEFECLALMPNLKKTEGKIALKDYKGDYNLCV